MSLSPAANIAITVAKARAERGDDVGPNVTLVLLAELEASQARVAEAEALLWRLTDRNHDCEICGHEANGHNDDCPWERFLQGLPPLTSGAEEDG